MVLRRPLEPKAVFREGAENPSQRLKWLLATVDLVALVPKIVSDH